MATPDLFLLNFGYLGLFISSYLAATILPFSTAALVLAMPALGFSPWLVGTTAVAGAFLGALTMYLLAYYGGEIVFERYIKVEPDKLAKGKRWFEKWGTPALLFSALPFVGDALVATAGLLRVRLPLFSFWLIVGRVIQYAFLLGLADTAVRWWPA